MPRRAHIIGANAQAMVAPLSALGYLLAVRTSPPYPEDVGEDLLVLAPGAGEGLARVRGQHFAVLAAPGSPDLLSSLASGALDAASSPEELAARLAARLGLRAEEAPARPASSRSPRILVVEDDPDIRALLELVLGSYDVCLASDGVEGLQCARAHPPDLVLTDLMLPGMDGFALLHAVAQEASLADAPVIILSARGAETDKVLGLGLGAVDYLSKPFSPVELLARVERSLRLSRQRKDLAALAQTDELTGLPNYRALCARLDEELKRARRYRAPLACLMLDLDRFKEINDRCGHEVGNQVLVGFARTLSGCLRETDFAARYGGDEFVVLLPETGLEEARATAARLAADLARSPATVPGLGTAVQASIGVWAQGPGELDAQRLVAGADAALRAAKRKDAAGSAPPRERRAAGAGPAP
ncbi:MAG TPA: diguanylate cyclase [Myxococcales bacterium]|jgi:diguanylate cyclase (GGDEF)-like protein